MITITKDGHANISSVIPQVIILAIAIIIIPAVPAFAATASTASGAAEAGAEVFRILLDVFQILLSSMEIMGPASTILGLAMLIWTYIDGDTSEQKLALIMLMSGIFMFGLQAWFPRITSLFPEIPAKDFVFIVDVLFLAIAIAFMLWFVAKVFFESFWFVVKVFSESLTNDDDDMYDEEDEYDDENSDISYDEYSFDDYKEAIQGYKSRLKDEDIVNQLQQMEDTLGWIIKTTEDDPDTVFMVRRLLEYYMPKTSRLLKTYADIERCPQKGKNMSNIMAEVKEVLGLLNGGMHNILDDMYQGKEMDISSDISVMKKMMVQDGMQEQYPDFHPGT